MTQMIKNKYPFLLGTTSYIIPDDILPNARMLAPIVDDIELVLFESREASNLPLHDTITELADLGKKYSISYTVHLPTDNKAGAADPMERTSFYDAAMKVIERCLPLSPTAWITHFEGIHTMANDSEINLWTQRSRSVIEKLCCSVDDPASIAIENLGYPWHWHNELAVQNKTSLCCDVGHLWLYFPDCWQEHLHAMLPKTRVIHLHGVCDSKDHLSLALGNKSLLDKFLNTLTDSNYCGVVTLEIFSEKDFYESIDVLGKEAATH
jgi:sugar phosphate isomerase/epimerase